MFYKHYNYAFFSINYITKYGFLFFFSNTLGNTNFVCTIYIDIYKLFWKFFFIWLYFLIKYILFNWFICNNYFYLKKIIYLYIDSYIS